MLCEKCNKATATVHITEVIADAPGEMKKHDFCEACFSQSDLAKKVSRKTVGWTNYSATFLPDDESGR